MFEWLRDYFNSLAEVTSDYDQQRGILLRHYERQLRQYGWYFLTASAVIVAGMNAAFESAGTNVSFAVLIFTLSLGLGPAF